MIRTGSEGVCGRCFAYAERRVELWIPSESRSLACPPCALAMAAEQADCGVTVTIKPFVSPMAERGFVAGDGSYFPNPRHAELHQRELESSAARFAKRVQGVITRALAARRTARHAA
jgi:hypothetical protein